MNRKLNLSGLAMLCLLSFANATDSLQVAQAEALAYQIAYLNFVDSIEQTWNYESGLVSLRDDVATIQVPAGFKYLNGEDSEMILTELWGNPPSEPADQSMGMLIPTEDTPMSDSTYVINITFTDDGYIEDEDARDIDYTELLETMQEDTKTESEYRIAEGYESIELVGWASPPFYDEANKKLHWAKELHFGDYEENTLNYNIRILGRRGFLELNAIGEMYVLDEVQSNIAPILSSVNFKEGHRYADFSPGLDKVAAYGIGGLIAGKVLAKAGILAKLGLLLAKFWKIIALAVVGLFAGVKKFFTKAA